MQRQAVDQKLISCEKYALFQSNCDKSGDSKSRCRCVKCDDRVNMVGHHCFNYKKIINISMIFSLLYPLKQHQVICVRNVCLSFLPIYLIPFYGLLSFMALPLSFSLLQTFLHFLASLLHDYLIFSYIFPWSVFLCSFFALVNFTNILHAVFLFESFMRRLFCTYTLDLYFFGERILAQKLLLVCW